MINDEDRKFICTNEISEDEAKKIHARVKEITTKLLMMKTHNESANDYINYLCCALGILLRIAINSDAPQSIKNDLIESCLSTVKRNFVKAEIFVTE